MMEMGLPVLCASRVNNFPNLSSSSSRSTSFRRHVDRCTPLNSLHGPLNAFSAASTAASTSASPAMGILSEIIESLLGLYKV